MENTNFLGNHYLGADFSIFATVLLGAIVVMVFYYREKIVGFFYRSSDMELFLKKLETKLKETYPNLSFDLSYLEQIRNEPNPDAKKYALIDNIVAQYEAIDFKPKNPKPIPSHLIWSSYAFNAKNNSKKLPEDWLLRKNGVFERDEKICQKCSKKLTLQDAEILFIRPIEKGGDYYFENMILVCSDCAKIEKYKLDRSTPLKYLQIREELYALVRD